jgi:hypothetical protein
MPDAPSSARRSVGVYRYLMRGYPRRFRAAYEDAIVDAFRLELEHTRRRSSAASIVMFWLFMGADLALGVAIMRAREGWGRLTYGARLLRGSTGFTAAVAMLAITPVWAWSRFATLAPGRAGSSTLTFAVSALNALLIWALARGAAVLCTRVVRRRRAVGGLRYTSVRRARLVARLAKISAAAFAVATLTDGRRGRVRDALVNSATPPIYWAMLALTLLGVVALYFAAGSWLHLRDANQTDRAWTHR